MLLFMHFEVCPKKTSYEPVVDRAFNGISNENARKN